MNAFRHLPFLCVLVSLSLTALACSGDDSLGGLAGETPGVGDGTGGTDGTIPLPTNCDDGENGARRCGVDGGIEVCTAGVWEDSHTCDVGFICDLGECVEGCQGSCGGKVCGDDGCGGLCGACKDGELCDDAGQCVVDNCTGNCAGLECGDDGCGGTCGVCPDGTMCNASGTCASTACQPDCGERECGDDGCGSPCGICDPEEVCTTDGQCDPQTCIPSCVGLECGDDGCGGNCGACADGESCDAGACVEGGSCEPSCDGMMCGDDGCGGSCGECGAGETCNAGMCEAGSDPCSGFTYEGCCDGLTLTWCENGVVESLDCSAADVASCGWDDGGGYYNCGQEGEGPAEYPIECAGTCEPSCDGMVCGSDGCGGTCGECGEGTVCMAGACVESACEAGYMEDCEGECIAASWLGDNYCDAGLNCEAFEWDGGDCCPDGQLFDCNDACADATLLGDGTCDANLDCQGTNFDEGDCEVVCEEGTIPDCDYGCTTESWLGDNICDSSLNCEEFDLDGGDCAVAGCGDGECSDDETVESCPEDCAPDVCTPSCDDSECGDDGCGGSCGECEGDAWCNEGICDDAPCVSMCDGMACGDDGCGSSCGECAAGMACEAGSCVDLSVEDGACTSPSDAAVIDDANFEDWMSLAGMACMVDPNFDDCFVSALAEESGLSAECAACYGEYMGCSIDQCMGDCLAGPDDEACIACKAAECGAALVECQTGDDTTPPVEGDATCTDILDCAGECDEDDTACVDACVAGGTAGAADAYNAWDECQSGCDTLACLEVSCADVGAACFWADEGDATCLDVNDCLALCDGDDACVASCFGSGTAAAQEIWLQLLWCINGNCSTGEPGEDYEGCSQAALSDGGVCVEYALACNLDGGGTIVDPEPVGEASCADILDCTSECDEDDDACTDACAADGTPDATDAYDAWSACLDGCDDMVCVEENCAGAGAACFWEGAGDLSCLDVNDCLGECDGDSECVTACFASSTEDAQQTWLQMIWCANTTCEALEAGSEEHGVCWQGSLAEGGACVDYALDCGFGNEDVVAPEGTASCEELAECVGDCDDGDTECEDACVEEGTNDAIVGFGLWQDCVESCEDMSCLADACASEGAACFWDGDGSDSCMDVNACLGSCDGEDECVTGCFLSASESAQAIWLQIFWCAEGACGDNEPGGDFDACWQTASSDGGACGGYVADCGLDGGTIEPLPETGATCDEITTCVGDCDEGDDTCTELCITEGSAEGAAAYAAWSDCLDSCQDMTCLETTCAGVGSACFWPGAGDLTCMDVNDCLGTCDGDDECVADCFAAGTESAQEIWLQIIWCANSTCVEFEGSDEYGECWQASLAVGGACQDYTQACFDDDGVVIEPQPEPEDGTACDAIYECQGECDTGDEACAEFCYEEATSAGQDLYDAADACFDDCATEESPEVCWAYECTEVGVACFIGDDNAGEDSCVGALECINECVTAPDFQVCGMGCLEDATSEAQGQYFAIQWCLSGACGDVDSEDIPACQEAAVGTDGVCELPATDCLGTDG